jgi:GNAT superfamily N-acetyltransferase
MDKPSRTIRIEHAPLFDHIGQVMRLAQDHSDEVGKSPFTRVNPQLDYYRAAYDAGLIVSLFASAEDVIVGYSINFLVPHSIYGDVLMLKNDLLYVAPEYRPKGLGVRLVRATEHAAEERGARAMVWNAVPDSALHWMQLHRGYAAHSVILVKEI